MVPDPFDGLNLSAVPPAPPPALRALEQVTVYPSFAALPPACRALFAADLRGGVFSSWEWHINLASTVLAREGELRIYVVQIAGLPQLLVPMWRPHAGEVRCLQPAANFYASLFAPLLAPGAQMARAVRAWADFLCSERPRWQRITLAPLSAADPLTVQMEHALAEAGFVAETYFCFANWSLALEGRSFEQYFQTLPSMLRNTVQRKAKQLKAIPAFRIALLASAADAEEALQCFQRVYAASWKEPEPYADFIPGLVHLCARRGWLRMGVAYLDGRAVACQLWIVHNGVASIYKLAYDEGFAKLSIGTVLTAALMQHVIDVDRVREVDYLTGDEAYKRDWMSVRRERIGIAAFNPKTFQGSLGAARHVIGRGIRSLRT